MSLNGTPQRAFPLPTIAEDTLQYAIHPPVTGSQGEAQVDPSALALLLTQYVESILPQPWLWNKDTFELKVVAASSHLEGRMRVGDAVDDEWLVVYLLREISIKYPDLVISIRDSDGEFLLIEAANELPGWVTPENAENRLWLQDGGLHLIPLEIRSGGERPASQFVEEDDEDGGNRSGPWISEEDGIKAVRSGKYRNEKVEAAVWERIACYPGALKTHQHHTKAYLPISIAKALAVSPELIQKAVEGFYVRDPSQLRTAARMTQFPPSPSILTPITLTRPAYAQLSGQIFHPPRIFGPEWHVRDINSDEASASSAEIKLEGEKRWRDLGVKIAVGFEIMYKEGGGKSRSGIGRTSKTVDLEHLKQDVQYQKYLIDLKRAGYFGRELEGSELWKKKEEEAVRGWLKIRSADTAQRPSFAYQVDQAISSASILPLSSLETTTDSPEDSDDWLEVSPDELDGMMLRASGQARGGGPSGGNEATQTTNGGDDKMELGDEHGQALQDLARKVEDFVGGQGDISGARFEDEFSDDLLDDDDSDSEDEDGSEDVQMTSADKEERMKTLVPGISPEEWGRKPSEIGATTSIPTSAAGGASSSLTPSRSTKESKASKNNQEALPKIRPPILAKEEYDGFVPDSYSSDESDGEDELPPPGTLGRKIAEMKWADTDLGLGAEASGGPSSASEKLEELERSLKIGSHGGGSRKEKVEWDDGIDEEMRRRVWGDKLAGDEGDAGDEEMDVDMGQEEEEFLKFSREALGISDEMWEGILKDRRGRGAFVPKPKTVPEQNGTNVSSNQAPGSTLPRPTSTTMTKDPEARPADKKHEPEPMRTSNITSVRFGSVAPATPFAPRTRPERPQPSDEQDMQTNMDLDSFEKVMQAMDEELAKARQRNGSGSAPSSSSVKPTSQTRIDKSIPKSSANPLPLPKLPTEEDLEDMDEDDLIAMDRELRAALKGAGIEDVDDDDLDGDGEGIEEVDQLDEDGKREYRMMRDFLESYKAQSGGSGVVGNLFGRLGAAGAGAGAGAGGS